MFRNQFHLWMFIFLIFLGLSQTALADDIIITGKKTIDKNTRYSKCKILLANGYFEVVNNARLEIDNCTIQGNVTPTNLQLIEVVSGQLIMRNNKVKITSIDIPKNPDVPIYNAISFSQGKLYLVDNKFSVDKPYTVSFLTTSNFYTVGFNIIKNEIRNFHGGLLLVNSNNAYIAQNRFSNVSLSNILLMDSVDGIIKSNEIFFPGNNTVGDGIDIMNSRRVRMEYNKIFSGSCYSIVILGGDDILLNYNRVMSGITYAISIQDPLEIKPRGSRLTIRNDNIIITNNYFGQNRYGVAASNVNNLKVENNIFVQRFRNDTLRKFWTNNAILLQKIKQLTWKNNLYKEAYSQALEQNDQISHKLVEFPITGGVSL